MWKGRLWWLALSAIAGLVLGGVIMTGCEQKGDETDNEALDTKVDEGDTGEGEGEVGEGEGEGEVVNGEGEGEVGEGEGEGEVVNGEGEGEGEEAVCEPFDGYQAVNRLETGAVVANFSFKGYADQDGDGKWDEDQEINFDMDDIRCTGADAAVILMAGLLCPVCPQRWQAISAIEQEINDAGGVMVSVVLAGLGQASIGTDQAKNYAGKYFESGFVTGTMPAFKFNFVPYLAVINLHTMEVMRVDSETFQMTPQQVLLLIDRARKDRPSE